MSPTQSIKPLLPDLPYDNTSYDANPVCSPDGKCVDYIDLSGLARLVRVLLDGVKAEPVTMSPDPAEGPVRELIFHAGR